MTVVVRAFTSGHVDAVRIYRECSPPRLVVRVEGKWRRVPRDVEWWVNTFRPEPDVLDQWPMRTPPRPRYTLDVLWDGLLLEGVTVNEIPVLGPRRPAGARVNPSRRVPRIPPLAGSPDLVPVGNASQAGLTPGSQPQGDDGCYAAGAVDTPGLHRPDCNAIRNGGACDVGRGARS